MSKKGLNLVAGFVTFAALAIGPMSASADVSWQCSPGMKDHHYCVKEIHCGKRGDRQHDCRKEDRNH